MKLSPITYVTPATNCRSCYWLPLLAAAATSSREQIEPTSDQIRAHGADEPMSDRIRAHEVDRTNERLSRGDRTQENRDGIGDRGDKLAPNLGQRVKIGAKREEGDRIRAIESRSNARAAARRSNPKDLR